MIKKKKYIQEEMKVSEKKVTQCNIRIPSVVKCYSVSNHDTQFHSMLPSTTMLSVSMLYSFISYFFVSYHVKYSHIMIDIVIKCYSVSYHDTQCNIMRQSVQPSYMIYQAMALYPISGII